MNDLKVQNDLILNVIKPHQIENLRVSLRGNSVDKNIYAYVMVLLA